MSNSETRTGPIGQVMAPRLRRDKSDSRRMKAAKPMAQAGYRESIKLFVKVLATISLCEMGIMILLAVLPLKSHWAVLVDPLLLIFLGTPILYFLLVRPIWHSLEQRNRAIAALARQKSEAQVYLDTAGVILVALDVAGNVTLVNRKGCEILGCDERDVLGQNWLEKFVPETERKSTQEFVEQVVAGSSAPDESFEGSILTSDRQRRLISWHVTVMHDDDGPAAGILCSGEDITRHRMVQEKLQQSERRYRSFVQNFQGIVFQGHMNFVPVFFHGAVERITGYRGSEFIAGKPRWDQVIHTDDLSEISKIGDELRTAPGYSREREYRIIRKDGQVRWVHELIQNVCDSSGKPCLVEGAIYDITERKQMEEDLRQYREHLEELVLVRTAELTRMNEQLQDEVTRRKELEKNLMAINEQLQQEITERKQASQSLQQSEERFRDFFENAPVGFHIFGPDRKIADINDAELDMIGYTKDEVVGRKTWADLILPEQRAEFEEHWRRMVDAGQVRSLNYTLVHKDGHYVDVLSNASARFDGNGHLINTRGSVLNITERRRLERELLNIVERERRRTGLELHDSIGQQLTGISLMLEVLNEKLSEKSLEAEVAYAEKAHDRIVHAAEQVRNLAKGLSPIDLDRHSLGSAMRELAAHTEQLMGISCSINCDTAVSAKDASVAMNLYRIAQEAITNAVRHGKARNIRIGLASEHGWLTLMVENDGLGFPAGSGHDAGMGLRIMRHRAEVINGSLNIEKGAHGGTIVTCVLSNRERPQQGR